MAISMYLISIVLYVSRHISSHAKIAHLNMMLIKNKQDKLANVIQSQKHKLFGKIYSLRLNLWSFLWSAKIVRIKKATAWDTSSELCNIIAQLIEA